MPAQSKNVVCSTVSTIVPKHQVPTTDYFLSNLDLAFASSPVYMLSVYYFRTKKDDPKTPSIQSLKDSFSELLSVYPVFAGRLKLGEEGRLSVDVNGEGVPFIEATTEASLDDWPDLHLCDIEQDLNPKDQLVQNIFTAPLLRVQFTSFQCGGIALGFNSLHLITDGLSITQFLKAWGELHRGSQISTPPQFESIRLRARNHPIVNVSPADEIFCSHKPIIAWPQPSDLLGKSIRCKNIVFRIERPMIDKCIEDVETGAFSYGKASSFEALSGLMWAAVTRARGLGDSAMTRYGFAVNVRERMQPPLSKGFFGNAAIVNQITANANEIKSNHFSFAASLIHKRLQMVDPEFIQSAIDWVELKLQQQQEVNLGFDTTNGSSIINTSWAHFPVYEIDFGWRKVDHFEFSIWDSFPGDGLCFILPAHPSAGERSREVKLLLREDHLERLMHDHYFQLYFGRNNNKEHDL